MAKADSRFINRELSWLEFNQRVLDEALDTAVPLLERVKFLAITGSNLDEFFMVRVGSLELLTADGVTRPDPSGLSPSQQIDAVVARVRDMVATQYNLLSDLVAKLREAGIVYVSGSGLSPAQLVHAERVFDEEVRPVVSPMAVRSTDEFPALQNLGLNLAVRLQPKEGSTEQRYAVIPVGTVLPRFVSVPAEGGVVYAGIAIEELVRLLVDKLFPGETVVECVPFRITRNAAMSVEEEVTNDFLEEMMRLLAQRRTGGCIRLEVGAGATRMLVQFLRKGLAVPDHGIYEVPGLLNLATLFSLVSLNGFDKLRYETWEPQSSPQVDLRTSIFETLSRRNVLLCHPYDSYEPVLRFIEEAADDPGVLAIKQTLYRTSPNSRVIAALRRAAERGKYVTALVELKARFDEARNIEWARELERAGVQVIYGVKGLKTHSKVCLVVRREPGGIVRYMHFGTGNYNERTARLYSDVSLMTRDQDLGADASACFNAMTGYSEPPSFLKLSMAPMGVRDRLLERIRGEAKRAEAGEKAVIMAKMNSLVDEKLIEALYKASQAGVVIQLNVRGICCLKPGVKPYSSNISVVSIVDRYLEHSRVFYFLDVGKEEVFISSADWMPRNLDRRIELMVPVDDTESRQALIAILETYFKDTAKSRRLNGDGSYERIQPEPGRKPFSSQEALYIRSRKAVDKAEKSKPTVFEPHRPPTAV